MTVSTTRLLSAALPAGVLAAGLTAAVVSAPAADAASGVSFCFVWADDPIAPAPGDGPGSPYADLPAYLMGRDSEGRAVKLRKMRTDDTGCGRFAATPTGRRLWVKAAYTQDTHTEENGNPVDARYVWGGRSPVTAKPGDGAKHLGTGKVRVTSALSATHSDDDGASLPPPK